MLRWVSGIIGRSEAPMRRFLLTAILLASACATAGPDRVVTLRGGVTNIDVAHQKIELGAIRNEPGASGSTVSYNSLTFVDRPTGTARGGDLQFGEEVIVHGRRDAATDEVTADRIVVLSRSSRK